MSLLLGEHCGLVDDYMEKSERPVRCCSVVGMKRSGYAD